MTFLKSMEVIVETFLLVKRIIDFMIELSIDKH